MDMGAIIFTIIILLGMFLLKKILSSITSKIEAEREKERREKLKERIEKLMRGPYGKKLKRLRKELTKKFFMEMYGEYHDKKKYKKVGETDKELFFVLKKNGQVPKSGYLMAIVPKKPEKEISLYEMLWYNFNLRKYNWAMHFTSLISFLIIMISVNRDLSFLFYAGVVGFIFSIIGISFFAYVEENVKKIDEYLDKIERKSKEKKEKKEKLYHTEEEVYQKMVDEGLIKLIDFPGHYIAPEGMEVINNNLWVYYTSFFMKFRDILKEEYAEDDQERICLSVINLDLHTVKNYSFKDKNINKISFIKKSDDRIYAGTDNGLLIFKNDSPEEISDFIQSEALNCVTEGNKEYGLLFGGSKTVYYLKDNKLNELVKLDNYFNGEDERITSMIAVDDILYIGGSYKGLIRINLKTMEETVIPGEWVISKSESIKGILKGISSMELLRKETPEAPTKIVCLCNQSGVKTLRYYWEFNNEYTSGDLSDLITYCTEVQGDYELDTFFSFYYELSGYVYIKFIDAKAHNRESSFIIYGDSFFRFDYMNDSDPYFKKLLYINTKWHSAINLRDSSKRPPIYIVYTPNKRKEIAETIISIRRVSFDLGPESFKSPENKENDVKDNLEIILKSCGVEIDKIKSIFNVESLASRFKYDGLGALFSNSKILFLEILLNIVALCYDSKRDTLWVANHLGEIYGLHYDLTLGDWIFDRYSDSFVFEKLNL